MLKEKEKEGEEVRDEEERGGKKYIMGIFHYTLLHYTNTTTHTFLMTV